MSKKEREGGVKKETMMVVAFAALVVGFLAGVFYSAQQPVPGGNEPPPGQAQMPNDAGAIISELEKETARHPENVAAWVQLGNHYFDADMVDKAIQAYERSLALDPENANVLTDTGVMFRRKGSPEEAIKYFNRAIQVNPRQEAAYFNKGVVYLHDLKDREKAVQAWKELVKVNPMATVQSGELVMELIENIQSKEPSSRESRK